MLTYNVNYGVAGDHEAITAILSTNADVVMLQETTPEWEGPLRDGLSHRYPYIRFEHCCGAGGMAIFSKHPILREQRGEPPDGGWFPAWRATLATPIGNIQVLNLHLRPQLGDDGSVVTGYLSTPPIRRREIELHMQLLEPGTPALIVGDLNESSGAAIGALAEHGYRTALREFDGAQDTWRWRTSFGTLRNQLDHILYGRQLYPLDVQVIRAGHSDHFPVLGVFARSGPVGAASARESRPGVCSSMCPP